MRKRYGRGKMDGGDEDDAEEGAMDELEANGDSSHASTSSTTNNITSASGRQRRAGKEKDEQEAEDGEQSDGDKENVHPNRKQQPASAASSSAMPASVAPASATTASGKKRGRKPGSANKEKAAKQSGRRKKPLQLQLPDDEHAAALHTKFEPELLNAYMEQIKQAGGLQHQMGMLIANHPECNTALAPDSCSPLSLSLSLLLLADTVSLARTPSRCAVCSHVHVLRHVAAVRRRQPYEQFADVLAVLL